MDIRYYFKKVDFSKIRDGIYLKDKNSLGYLIEQNSTVLNPENIQNVRVAIIGVPFDKNSPNKGTALAPDKIRSFLYPLSNMFPELRIIDLGNLKKGRGINDIYFAVRDVVDYLRGLNIVTVILGGGQDIGLGVAKAFNDERYFQMSTVDPKIDLKTGREPFNSLNYISRLLKEFPDIFNINFIGYQSYFVSRKTLSEVEKKSFQPVRLGQVREDISALEPMLRDSHFVSFDISSVRLQDAPGFFNGSPNGFYSEEACQISRYAGMSQNLRVFGLFEVNPKTDRDNQTLKLAAQIVWYCLEGINSCRQETQVGNKTDFIEYNVEIEEMDSPLVFYQHTLTNRWWMRVEGLDKQKIFLACPKSDYDRAANKDIPSKWLRFIRKIDQKSK